MKSSVRSRFIGSFKSEREHLHVVVSAKLIERLRLVQEFADEEAKRDVKMNEIVERLLWAGIERYNLIIKGADRGTK